MNEICRLCLKEGSRESMKEITSNCELSKKISKCLSLELLIGNNLPKGVCTTCNFRIDDFVSFQERVIENEKILLSTILNKQTQQSNEICNINISDSENCSTENNEYVDTDINIKTENLEFSNDIKREIKEEVPSKPFQKFNERIIDSTKNQCLMCFKSFNTKKVLLQHYLNKNTQIKVKTENEISNERCEAPFVCKICGKIFKNALGFLNHDKSHTNNKFTCSFNCGYSSGYKHVLKNHEKTHTREYKYTCKDCGKGFHVKTWYDQHQNLHKGIKDYVCNICGASFHMDLYLTSHKISYHPDSYTQKRYVCIYCFVEFGTKEQFNIHLQQHGIKNECLCEKCGKVMKDKKQLTAHKLQHSTNRPFVCGKCGKTFAKKYNWKVHLRTHSNDLGEKFECTVCMKAFTQQSALNRHERSIHKIKASEEPKNENKKLSI